jgi:hypothetical protein
MALITTRASKGSGLTNNEIDANFTNLNDRTAGIRGFKVLPSSLTFTNSGSFTLSVNGNHTVVIDGTEYAVTGPRTKNVAWASLVEGPNYFYYNVVTGTLTLQHSTSPFTFDAVTAPVAVIYWQAGAVNAPLGGIGYECHAATMDWKTHEYLHSTRGTAYISGGGISGYTIPAGNTVTNAELSYGLASAVISDEDIRITCAAVADPSSLPCYYRDASGNWRTVSTTYGLPLNTGIPRYNSIGVGLADVPDGSWFAMFIFATNLVTDQWVVIPGQRTDTSLVDAQSNNTMTSLQLGSLFTTEFKPMYRIVYRYDVTAPNAITNSDTGIRAMIAFVEDLRGAISGGSSAVTASDHGSLSGLADPDHPASAIYCNVSAFTGNLTSADDTVQKALNTLSGMAVTASYTGLTNKPTLSDWVTNGGQSLVAGMLGWKANGNGMVIFDASASTSPTGSAISNFDPANTSWTAGHPILMGWNGTSTYPVKVHRAAIAAAVDSQANSATINASITSDGLSSIVRRNGSDNIYANTLYVGKTADNSTATHYFYEASSTGALSRKAIADVKAEIVTSAAVNTAIGGNPFYTTTANNLDLNSYAASYTRINYLYGTPTNKHASASVTASLLSIFNNVLSKATQIYFDQNNNTLYTRLVTDPAGTPSYGSWKRICDDSNISENINYASVTGALGFTPATDSHNHSGVYQPVDADLTAIAALAGTSGFLKKTAADTWALDTSVLLSGGALGTPASGNLANCTFPTLNQSTTGNAYTATTAAAVTVNDSNSNADYRMLWHSFSTVYSTDNITCNPYTNAITATTFIGALSGNATTATTATNLSGGSVSTGTCSTAVGTQSAGMLEVKGDGTYGAIMTFHRAGAYAINMGLETDNVFRLGGWSDTGPTYRFQVNAAGNFQVRKSIHFTDGQYTMTPAGSGGTTTFDFANGQKQKCTMSGGVANTFAFSFPGTGHYQVVLITPSNTITWPSIGASWQWLNATAAPTLHTGTYGGVLNLFYDGSMVLASYTKLGAV